MDSAAMETAAADVFFSIFFVTVVRSFAPGVGFKDRAAALGEAAGFKALLDFAARTAAANLAGGAATVRLLDLRSAADLAELDRFEAERAENPLSRALTGDLAAFDKARPLLACALLARDALGAASPAFMGGIDLAAALRRVVLTDPSEAFDAAGVRAELFAALDFTGSLRVFLAGPPLAASIPSFPRANFALAGGDFRAVEDFEFLSLAFGLPVPAFAAAAFFDFGSMDSLGFAAFGFRAAGRSA